MRISRGLVAATVTLASLAGASPARGGAPPPDGACEVQTLAIPADAVSPAVGSFTGVAGDDAGNIYVTDSSGASPRVLRFDADGVTTLTITPLMATPDFFTPWGVDTNPTGSLIYFADPSVPIDETVFRFTGTGTQDLAIENVGSGPWDVDADPAGNMYVAASTGLLQAGVYRFDPSGAQTMLIPSTAATPNMVGADSVAVDGDGNIYVAAMGTDSIDRVYRFDQTGTQTLAMEIGGRIGGVAVDAAGSFYLSAQDAKTINRYDPAGNLTLVLPTDLADPPLQNPIGIHVSPDGTVVLVADNQAAHGYRFELDNTTLTPGIVAAPDLIHLDATTNVTVSVVDDGLCDADDVTVTAALPAGLELVDAVAPAGTSYDGASGVWSVGRLESGGDPSTLTLTVRGAAAGVYRLDATANAVASDTDPATASTTLTVLAPIEPTFTG